MQRTNFALRLMLVFLCALLFSVFAGAGIVKNANPKEHDVSEKVVRISSPYVKIQLADKFSDLISSTGGGIATTVYRIQKRASERPLSFPHMPSQLTNELSIFLFVSVLGILYFPCAFNRHVLLPHSIHAPPYSC